MVTDGLTQISSQQVVISALSNAATPSPSGILQVEGQGRGSSLLFTPALSPKRSRKYHRSESSGGSSNGLKYFLLSDSLLCGHGQASVTSVCSQSHLESLRTGSGRDSLSLSHRGPFLVTKWRGEGRGPVSGIVSRKFCKFVATSSRGQPVEAAMGCWCMQTRLASAAVLQTRPQLLQLESVVAMRDELLHRS